MSLVEKRMELPRGVREGPTVWLRFKSTNPWDHPLLRTCPTKVSVNGRVGIVMKALGKTVFDTERENSTSEMHAFTMGHGRKMKNMETVLRCFG